MHHLPKSRSLSSLACFVSLVLTSSALTIRSASVQAEPVNPQLRHVSELTQSSALSIAMDMNGKFSYHKGKTRTLGAGKVTSFVVLDENQKPYTVGLKFTKSALENLPQNCSKDKIPETSFWEFCFGGKLNDAMVTIFQLPKAAAKTNIATLELSWLPHGHAPEKVWDKPQFDIHVNFTDPTGGKDASKFYTEVPPGGLPEGYIILPGSGFPWDTPAQQGHSHSADPRSSPEFGGGPFTTNFIYITYGGKVIGYEPYVAFDYLKSQTSIQEIPIRSPKFYPQAGYYATTIQVGFDAKSDNYIIALTGFKWFEAMKSDAVKP